MPYLLDTNVLSKPIRRDPDPGVVRRLDEGRDAVCCGPLRWFCTSCVRLDVFGYDDRAALWHASVRARSSKPVVGPRRS